MPDPIILKHTPYKQIRAGLFDDVDAVVTWHPGDRNTVSPVSNLAKRLADAPPSAPDFPVTVTGQVLGTPSYLPPEQASGSRGAVRTA